MIIQFHGTVIVFLCLLRVQVVAEEVLHHIHILDLLLGCDDIDGVVGFYVMIVGVFVYFLRGNIRVSTGFVGVFDPVHNGVVSVACAPIRLVTDVMGRNSAAGKLIIFCESERLFVGQGIAMLVDIIALVI